MRSALLFAVLILSLLSMSSLEISTYTRSAQSTLPGTIQSIPAVSASIGFQTSAGSLPRAIRSAQVNPNQASATSNPNESLAPAVGDGAAGGMSLSLQPGGQIYLFALADGGVHPTSRFQYGQYADVIDQAGQIADSVALTTSDSDNYTTQDLAYAMIGVPISGYSNFTSFEGQNTSLNADATTVSFQVTSQNSLAVLVALGSSQSFIAVHGFPGLTVAEESANISTSDPAMIGYSYLSPGNYSVKENTRPSGNTTASAVADMLEVIVFSPLNPSTSGRPYLPLLVPIVYGLMLSINGVATPAPGTTITKVEISWGDSSQSTTTGFPASHTYSQPGNYVITVTVYDSDGLTFSDSLPLPMSAFPGDSTSITTTSVAGATSGVIVSSTEATISVSMMPPSTSSSPFASGGTAISAFNILPYMALFASVAVVGAFGATRMRKAKQVPAVAPGQESAHDQESADRYAELKRMLAAGSITPDEYDAQVLEEQKREQLKALLRKGGSGENNGRDEA
jgi:hypothetical protein